MKIDALRQTIGFSLAVAFFLLVALMMLMALDAFLGQLPGYPIFFFSCSALIVCCFRLGSGKAYGVISVQCFALLGIVGVFLDGRNYRDLTYFVVFLLPLFAALVGAQVIKARTRKLNFDDGETA